MSSSFDQLRSSPWHGRHARVGDAQGTKSADIKCSLSPASPTQAGRPCHTSHIQKESPSPRFASSFAPSRLRGSSAFRRGFTFTEILFAVLILGIGFILIAAIFPVAIKQTQTSAEETTAATIAKGGVSYLVKYNTQANWYTPNTATLPDGLVHAIGPNAVASEPIPTNTTLWPLISGNLILPSDSRYAWIPMYRQGLDPTTGNTKPLPYIQVIVIGVQARNRSFYDSNDLATRANNMVTLEARPVLATFVGGTTETVTFSAVAGDDNTACISDSAFVVVANDTNGGATNGWIFRLGANVSPGVWGLAPGYDLTNAAANQTPGANSVVMVIGSGYTDTTSAPNPTYYGPCQDVAAYTTFIPVH